MIPIPRRRINVVVVDDHEVIWLGLTSGLGELPTSPIRLVGYARTVAGLHELLDRGPCDVVVLDLLLEDGSNPPETIRALLQRGLRVLVYSIAADPPSVRRALRAGAHGLSRKSEPVEETLAKIEAVAAGEQLISPDILAMIDGDPGFVDAQLSSRETEVLIEYVSGLEVPQLSRKLFITEQTAKEYLKRIRKKYSEIDRPSPTKVDLLQRAIEDGIIPPILPR